MAADRRADVFALGAVLYSKGRDEDAEPYYRRCVEGRRRVLGDDHRATLRVVNDMGYLLLDDAGRDERKKLIANRFAVDALAKSRKNFESIMANQFSDLAHAAEILG